MRLTSLLGLLCQLQDITGTLKLLEAAAAVGVGAFVFTSTTSAFGGCPGGVGDRGRHARSKNIWGSAPPDVPAPL
jgi:nucleoside-diphosphate-sugar epimerase